MFWIADAISGQSKEILEGVKALLDERTGADAPVVPFEEVMKQAELTLELLIAALGDGGNAPLLERWEAIGRSCSERDFAMVEIPNTPDLVKRAIWSTMEKQVEGGAITLSDLVDAMMVVESVLSDCWFVMVRSYLGEHDIRVTARTARMEALYSLTEVLSTETDKFRMYRGMVDKLASITGISRCSLLLFDEGGELEPVASNYVDAMDLLKLSSPGELAALAAVVSLGGPVILQKGSENPPEIESVLDNYKAPTVLLVPLKSGERELGLLLLDDGSQGEFTREQIDMAIASANQVANAVEKSDLLSEMETRLKHMAAIGIVARTVSSFLDTREQLESLLEIATALIRADRGVIMLSEEMFGHLKIVAKIGEPDWLGSEEILGTVADWVAENREPVLLRKGSRDNRFKELDMKAESSITAPLPVRDKVIGVISVASGKPGDDYSSEDVEMFGNFAAQAAVSIENTQLYDRLQDTYLGAIGSLAAAIEARDPYTVGHSARVTQYAVAIAEGMGLTAEKVDEIRLAGLLHDLGKIGVPDSILNKPGRLSDEEYSAIKMHPTLSMKIIEPMPQLGHLIPIIYHHHERYDGDGYVDGKAGDKIPLGARIIAVADSYEAMTSDRPYRTALSREEAIAEIRRNSGSQFDPAVVEVFLNLLEKTAGSG